MLRALQSTIKQGNKITGAAIRLHATGSSGGLCSSDPEVSAALEQYNNEQARKVVIDFNKELAKKTLPASQVTDEVKDQGAISLPLEKGRA